MPIQAPELRELLTLQPCASYTSVEHKGLYGFSRGGSYHISAVLPAVSSAIGYPISTQLHPTPRIDQEALGIPDVKSIIVVLVDGLGFWNIVLRIGHVPYLRFLLQHEENQRPISTCFPSTTVSAMGTFGTGTCPGLTGMVGYTQLNTQTHTISQMIQFRDAIAPEELQQEPTIFEQLQKQGVRITAVGLPK
ncbi:MAG: alkaline phosphatase family protein, partial [Bifidobacteriaceae bacterium]|nr:alkaline phosphatase family protein [Bifidobacteriaceae bacterium]